MPARTIPILPVGEQRTPALSGEPEQLHHVLAALETALQARIGWRLPTATWLRELRLGDGEAYVAITPELGGACGPSAEVAFDTLRRLLPDTDIFVGAARG
jgi:hypothetical protein